MRTLRFFPLLLLAGCAAILNRPAPLSLPPISWLDCCWQRTEILDIQSADLSHQGLGVIVRSRDQLNLVLLDSLGRTLGSVSQDASGTLQVQSVQPLPLSAEELLLGLYLRFADDGVDWASRGYERHEEGGIIQLLRDGNPLIELRPLDSSGQLQLHYVRSNIRLTLTPATEHSLTEQSL